MICVICGIPVRETLHSCEGAAIWGAAHEGKTGNGILATLAAPGISATARSRPDDHRSRSGAGRPGWGRPRLRAALSPLPPAHQRLHLRDGPRPRPRGGPHPRGLRLGAAPHASRPTGRSSSSRGSTRSPRTRASTRSGAPSAPRRSASMPTRAWRRLTTASSPPIARRPTRRLKASSNLMTFVARSVACRTPTIRSW